MPVVTEIMETLTFESSPDLIGNMLCLPQPLLCKWLEAQGPVLDFKGSHFLDTDLSRCLSCFPQIAWRGICELHLPFNGQNPNRCESSLELTNLPEGKFFEWRKVSRKRYGDCEEFLVPTHLSIGSECLHCQTVSAYFKSAPAVPIDDVGSNSTAIAKLCSFASNVNK